MADVYGFSDAVMDSTGNYEFTKTDGSKIYLAATPETDEVYRRLQRENQPNRGFSGEDPTAPLTDEGYPPMSPATQRAVASIPPPYRTPKRENRLLRVAPKAAEAAVQAEQAPPAQPQATPLTPDEQNARLADAYIYEPVRVPGVPGRNPTYEITHGMQVPRGGVESVTTDTLPSSPEDIEARTDAHLERLMAERQMADARLRAAQEAQQLAIQERRLAEQEGARARRIRDQAQKHADEMLNVVRTTEQEARAGKIDPDKYFKDRGTWGTILGAVAMGLGAYGAALVGGRNYAQEIINSAIERDIEAQRVELDNKNQAAGNALASYRQIAGDRDLAEAMLRDSMKRIVAAKTDELAASAAGAIVEPEYAKLVADRRAEFIRSEQELANKAFGTRTSQLQTEWAVARAGSAGGYRPPTVGEMAKRAKEISDLTEAQRTAQGGLPQDAYKDLRYYGDRKRDVIAAQVAADRLAGRLGLQVTPNGQVVVPPDWKGADGHGWTGPLSEYLKTTSGRTIGGDVSDLTSLVVKARSGTAATDAERKELRGTVAGYYDIDLTTGLQRIFDFLHATELNIDSQFDPQIVEQYRKNYRKRVEEGNRATSEQNRDREY